MPDANVYLLHFCGSTQSYALAVLAYHRLIAICFPLRQNSINTRLRMSTLMAITWSFALGTGGFATGFMSRLSFCKSVRVVSYFCDGAPVFGLACNDNRLQWLVASTLTMVALVLTLTFIILSYVSIPVTIFKMESIDSRNKALATCTERLTLVAIYYQVAIYYLPLLLFSVLASTCDP